MTTGTGIRKRNAVMMGMALGLALLLSTGAGSPPLIMWWAL